MAKSEGDAPPDRRRFLKLATGAIGTGVGLVIAAPVLRMCGAPVGQTTVTSPTEPIDIGSIDSFIVGAEPRRVEVIAPVVKDAWTASQKVVLGAAWVRRLAQDKIHAFSSVCPHLGCAVGWDASSKKYLCPCHDSRFAVDGPALSGPSQRGLDDLPVTMKDGRLQLVWKRFKLGTSIPEQA